MRIRKSDRQASIAALMLAILLWPATAARAAGGGPSGPGLVLNTALSVDAADDRDAQVGAQVALGDSTMLSFLGEYTSSPAARTDLVTHTYSAGFNQNFGRRASLGLRYESWGKAGELTSDSLYGSLGWNGSDWQLTALPGVRRISLYTRGNILPGITLPNKVELTDRPLGLRVDYTGLNGWLFEASSTRHNYTRNPAVLGSRSALLFFTGSVLTLSQGFLAHSATARIERDFGLTSLAFDYEIDRSAIDGSYAYTSDIDFTTPISDSFDMEIVSGITRSAHTPQTGFITFNLIYYH